MDFALKNGDGLIYEPSNNDKIENIDKRICESEQMQVFASWIMMWWPWHRRCLEDGPIRGQAGATLTNERAETGCHDMSPTSQVTSLGELKRPWHERERERDSAGCSPGMQHIHYSAVSMLQWPKVTRRGGGIMQQYQHQRHNWF